MRGVESLVDGRVTGRDLDALPATSFIAVGVGFSGREVLDVQTRHGHGEWSLLVVCYSTCPFDCAIGIGGRVTTSPDTEPDAHGCLWEVLAVERDGIVVIESANKVVVDVPLDFFSGPNGGVVVESEGVVDWVPDGAVVGGGVSFT